MKILNRDLRGFTGTAWLVDLEREVSITDWNKKEICRTRFFVVSGTVAMYTGWEILVFPADGEGNILDWGEVAGGRGISYENAIEELEQKFGVITHD